MTALASLVLAGCLAVESGSDQIRAADLAPGFPEMAVLAAGLAIAPAPAPGVVRIFHPAELRRLATLYALPSAPQSDICVERPLATLDPARMLDAMRRQIPEARIELLDFGRQPAPVGPIEFPKGGLRTGPALSAAGRLWMGSVRYGSNHRFSVWARVRIVVRAARVLARSDLPPGQPITAAQVELMARDEVPAPGTIAPAFTESLDEVIGKWPRQPIRAGEPIRSRWLQAPQAVKSGETVLVDVRDGGAQLEFKAQAEASGAIGDFVYVRNPDSHRRFRARVEAVGRVAVGAAAAEPKEIDP
jgi:flagella basal body P-ring formation protein FlgA